MRDLVLHIGLHKTGSTYLQHVLLANRAAFAAAGLELGPALHPGEGNHYPLIRGVQAAGWTPAAFAAALDAVAAAPGTARLLLTAEEFGGIVLQHADRAAAFRDAVMRRFRPRVVIFLRRQDHLQESSFGQVARTWYHGPIGRYDAYDLDHDARLARLEALFGRENLRVALYRDEAPNDLVGAFLTAAGVSLDRGGLAEQPPRNRSMHRRQVLFMSELPKDPRARTDRDRMRLAHQIADAVRASDAIADDGGRYLMSPRERHALVARHLEGNRALVARHGLADPGGFVALPDPDAPWTPPAPITAGERAAAFAAVLRAFWGRRNLIAALGASARAGGAFARMGYRA